jgi:hypothetical protein
MSTRTDLLPRAAAAALFAGLGCMLSMACGGGNHNAGAAQPPGIPTL